MNTPDPILCATYAAHYSALISYVSRAWPRLCESRVEDAVSDAFTVAAADRELLRSAYAKGGERQVVALLRVIAWRCARSSTCRGAAAWERSWGADTIERGQASDQEFVVDLRLHLAGAALQAARQVLPSAPERLAVAVLDRLTSGDTDGEVATRHGLRREYVNSARRLLEQQVGAAMA